jgi:hypothetical protein
MGDDMIAHFALPFRRMGALLTVLALALSLTAAMTLTSPAADASTGCNNYYDGGWNADNPNGDLITIANYFSDCSRLDSGQVYVAAHPWLGLSSGVSYWGAASSVTWGYYGTSLTATWVFNGLTESLYIRPADSGRLVATQTESYANGTHRVLPDQWFHHA